MMPKSKSDKRKINEGEATYRGRDRSKRRPWYEKARELGMIEDLAKTLHAALACSRPRCSRMHTGDHTMNMWDKPVLLPLHLTFILPLGYPAPFSTSQALTEVKWLWVDQ